MLEERRWHGNPLMASGERKVGAAAGKTIGEAGARGHVAEVDWPNWHFWPSCHIPA